MIESDREFSILFLLSSYGLLLLRRLQRLPSRLYPRHGWCPELGTGRSRGFPRTRSERRPHGSRHMAGRRIGRLSPRRTRRTRKDFESLQVLQEARIIL